MREAMDAVLALALPFLDRSDRRQLIGACSRDAAVRQQWFARYGRVLLPCNLNVATRIMTGHTLKPFITHIVADNFGLLHAVPVDLPALSRIEIVNLPDDIPLQFEDLEDDAEPDELPPSVSREGLQQATSLDDVVVLTRFPNLTALTLPSLDLLTADTSSLGDVLAQLTKLRELSLHDVSLSTLTAVHKLTRLHSLKLQTHHVLDLVLLRDLTCLELLDIRGCRVTNVNAFTDTATSLSLKTLVACSAVVVSPTGTAERSPVAPVDNGESILLQALIDAATRSLGGHLSALNLAGMDISSIDGLPTLKNLTALSLTMPEEMDWRPLLQLPKLQYLNQHGDCVVDTEQWGILAALPALRVLRDPTAITDDEPLEQVEQLIVHCSDDDTSPGLCDWPSLTSLKWVGACHIEFVLCLPDQLRHLALELDYSIELDYIERLTQLESLRVRCHHQPRQLEGDEAAEPGDYSFLDSLVLLERLELENEPFNDLEVLRPLQKLRHLSVKATLVADVGPLLSLPSLEYVDLSAAPCLLDDSVHVDVGSVLRQHPSLRRLRHPRGHDLIAPFTPDDTAPPPVMRSILSNEFDFIE